MFQKTGAKFKVEEFVEITLSGRQPFAGYVFLSVGDRLIDLLNDARRFIPIKQADGNVMIVAKSSIETIIERNPFEEHVAETVGSGFSLTESQTNFDENDEDDATYPNASEDEMPKGNAAKDGPENDNKKETDGDTAGKKPGGSARKKKRFDAYAVLKITPSATMEEVRAAYKERVKAVHPDTLAGLNLDEGMMEAALQTTKKLNYAYHTILKERREVTEPEQAA